MLNQKLYDQLLGVFGTVQVSNEGTPGTFEIPPPKSICCTTREKRRMANVTGWGEVYKVCCPFCDDKEVQRFRLVFSHLFGSCATEPKKKSLVHFSRYLVRCHNEHCHMRKEFREWLETSGLGYESPDMAILLDTAGGPGPEVQSYRQFLGKTIELPPNTLSLTSGSLPGFVYSYCARRQWDVQDLADNFGCRFVPKGTVWQTPPEATPPHVLTFDQDRLLIPIIQGRRLVGWQARVFVDDPDIKRKYLNPPGLQKSAWLYNYDQAMMHPTVVVCEGVSDVWRIGENAVALFGHSLSPRQLELMKLLWGMDGRCLLFLDHDADAEADIVVEKIRASGAFPRGVMKVPLQDDRDPGSLPRSYLAELLTWAEALLEKETNVD